MLFSSSIAKTCGIATVLVFLATSVAHAADSAYPSKPVRLIVPYAPGGGTDIVARLIGQKLNEAWERPVVVENRSGASGTIGTDIVVKAPADGHTLLITNIGLAFNATLFPRLPYDTLRDLAPVSLVANQPNVLLVHPSLPVKTVRVLVALAKARPGAISYSTGGAGSGTHLAAELFRLKAKIEVVHIPYKGAAPALIDLIGGHVQMMVSSLSPALPYIQSGRVRALAVTSAERSPALPDTPTLTKAGVAGYEFTTWHGLFAPAATPQPVVARISAQLKAILATPELREKYAVQGLEVASNTPAEFAALLKLEIDKWGEVVRIARVQAE